MNAEIIFSPVGLRKFHTLAPAVFLMACILLYATPVFAAPMLVPQPNRIAAGKDLDSILLLLDSRQRTIISIQRELVARPGINPEHGGEGENEKARWIEQWLSNHQINYFDRLDYPDSRVAAKIRPNLLISSVPAPERQKMLWVFARLDVPLPAPLEDWTSDPFSLRVSGDNLYGRGVADNNQAIASSLILLDALWQSKASPPVGFGLVLVSGALIEFEKSLDLVLRERKHFFKPDDMYILLHHGNERGCEIEVTEMANLWFKVTITGTPGYVGYHPLTGNALAAGASMIARLPWLDFPSRNQLFQQKTLFTPTKVEANNADTNHVSKIFTFHIDVRIDPDYPFDLAEQALTDLARSTEKEHEVQIHMERIVSTPPSPATATDAPVVRALREAIKTQLGVEPSFVGTSAASMATELRYRGLPTAVWGIFDNQRNMPDEKMSIQAQINQAKVLARMLFQSGIGSEK